MNANVSKTNGVKLLAVVAVLAMMVCAFAAIMPAEKTDAASTGIITEIGGGIKASEDGFVLTQYTTGEVVVVSDFIIPNNTALVIDGAKFTVNQGVTVTIQPGGQLVFAGTSNVIINGSIVANGVSSDDTYEYVSAIVNNVDENDKDVGVKVNGSVSLLRGSSMTIAANSTVIGNNAGTEGVDKYTFDDGLTSGTNTGVISLAKEGATLTVQKTGVIISSITNQTVYLVQGSTFTVNGNADVTVTASGTATYYTAGSMQIDAAATTGQKTTSNLTFTVSTQTVSGFVSDSATDPVTIREYVLDVTGTVAAGDTLKVIDGEQIYTGNAESMSAWNNGTSKYYETTTDTNGDVVPSTDNLVTKTSINGSLSIAKDGNLTIVQDTYTTITGKVTVGFDKDAANKIAIAGDVVVSGSITMDWGSMDDAGNNGGMLIMDGGSVDITNVEYNDAGGDAGYATNPQIYLYGATYQTESEGITTLHIRNLDVAVTEATAAEATEVIVYSYGAATSETTVDDARDAGAYVLEVNVTIPEGMTFIIAGAVVVEEDVSITFSEGSYALNAFNGKIFVAGKVVDEAFAFYGQDTIGSGYLVYEVKKVSEDETVTTYTTLAIALSEAQPGETIELVNKITISENLKIPADVTVVAIDGNEAVTITDGATLTIDGTLELQDNSTIVVTSKEVNSNQVANGSIVVNGYIKNAEKSDITCTGVTDFVVPGAYYQAIIGDDEESVYYITSVAVASTNSANVTSDKIQIYGKVTVGDVSFTKGDATTSPDTLEIVIEAGAEVNAGTITLDDVSLSINNAIPASDEDPVVGYLSGTVTVNVTAGAVTFDLDKAQWLAIDIDAVDNGETITTSVEISSVRTGVTGSGGEERNPVLGGITLVTGTATLVDNIRVVDLTIAEGAELIIDEGKNLYADDDGADYGVDFNKMPIDFDAVLEDIAPVVVNGTLTVNGGLNWDPVVVNGTIAFGEKSVSNFSADIHGTVTIADGADVTLYIAVMDGTITGDFKTTLTMAYPGADLSAVTINDTDNDGDIDAYTTNFYLNGELFVTVYTSIADLPITLFPFIADDDSVRAATAEFYSDEGMTDEIIEMPENYLDAVKKYVDTLIPFDDNLSYTNELGTAYTSDYENVYVSMDAAIVNGTVSEGTGLNLFIDNVAFYPNENQGTTGFNYSLTVGTHTVRYDVSSGYDATNAVITFNGQTVENGGTITITADMVKDGFTLTVSGAVPAQSTVVIDDGNGGSDMGLTDYLLIILVILIVVMAIMVAMRLMRS